MKVNGAVCSVVASISGSCYVKGCVCVVSEVVSLVNSFFDFLSIS